MIALEAGRPALVTPRLRLRFPRPADAPEVAWYANDLDVARMTTGIPHPYGLEQARAFLDRVEMMNPDEEALFAIEATGEGVIGLVGFHTNDEDACEIGYWLGRPYWGRGLMTEAVRCAVEWAARAWGRRFLVSGHFADNEASGRVLIKAGFLYTGETRWRFSLARGEAAPTRMMVWLA
ncbi:MAG TPA: GNAT family N-acetyltransferase [Caulobacteraceae bacterium]|jgi:RimJ/RimL family protein N-acetyltransferase